MKYFGEKRGDRCEPRFPVGRARKSIALSLSFRPRGPKEKATEQQIFKGYCRVQGSPCERNGAHNKLSLVKQPAQVLREARACIYLMDAAHGQADCEDCVLERHHLSQAVQLWWALQPLSRLGVG